MDGCKMQIISLWKISQQLKILYSIITNFYWGKNAGECLNSGY